MSRRLQERHRTLREAEVFLQDVPRHGSFRVALVYPNLYFVGMSNLGFQSVYQLLNAMPDVVCERAFLPDDVDKDDLERTGSPLVSFETGTPLRRLRRARLLGLLRERLPARPAGAAARRHPAARAGPRAARSARDPRRRGDVPEPGAAGAVRRPDGGGRGRAARAEDDGRAAGRARRARAGSRSLPAEGRLLRALALRGALPRRRHRRRLRRARARGAPARLAGEDGASRSRSS